MYTEVVQRCPIETTLAVIGGKWKPVIIYHLRSGPKRFGQLRRLMPHVTQRMLTAHLRELEGHGVVHREVAAVVPPRVDYSLHRAGSFAHADPDSDGPLGTRLRGDANGPVYERGAGVVMWDARLGF
jgi:DNA-binding HxlR family transcriptional regulator